MPSALRIGPSLGSPPGKRSIWPLTGRNMAVSASRFRQPFGARPVAIDAAEHDRLLAAVSHLPHVLANVLVAQAAGRGELPRTGPSFRDATRRLSRARPRMRQVNA